MRLNVLCIGDLFSKHAVVALEEHLPKIMDREDIDFTIVNGENVTGGIGLNKRFARRILAAGADCITLGNHSFNNKDIFNAMDEGLPIIRPYNFKMYPNKGLKFHVLERNGVKLGVINPIGKIFLDRLPIDSPFDTIQEQIKKIRAITPNIIVDFHAEATSEKQAMGYFLNGKVSAVVGTHTHVQTADETVLSKGTAYITDMGMSGPHDSIIGMNKDEVLQSLVTKEYVQFKPAKENIIIHGVVISIDPESGEALSIKRIKEQVA